MKTLILLTGCSILLLFTTCQQDTIEQEMNIPDIDPGDYEKELVHTPTGEVRVNSIKIDFGCDENMSEHIFEYTSAEIDALHTRGALIRFYEDNRPHFQYLWSSLSYGYFDGEYVFSKLEYRLAQECVQDNCSSQTRRKVLQIAIEKQKYKDIDYLNAYTARRTGLFLMSVILIKENNAAFVKAVRTNVNLQNALCLNRDTWASPQAYKELRDTIVEFADKFLDNQ
jgi:hypothetical protein